MTMLQAVTVRDDWPVWERHGKVTAFAAKLGLTVPQLRAEIAATSFRQTIHWSRVSDETMRLVLEAFERSSLGIGRFASKHGYPAAGLTRALQDRFGNEYTSIADSRMIAAGNRYRLGADLERRIQDRLERHGFYVVRSAKSGGAADLLAVRPEVVLFIQAKRGGILPREDWNTLYAASTDAGGVPVMVENPHPRTTRWWELLAPREHGTSGLKRPLQETFADLGLMGGRAAA